MSVTPSITIIQCSSLGRDGPNFPNIKDTTSEIYLNISYGAVHTPVFDYICHSFVNQA